MRAKDYDNVVSVINSHKGEDCTQRLMDAFPRLEPTVLCSIYSQEVQKRVKRSYQHYMQPSKMTRIYNKYLNAVERGEGPGILISMARSYNFSAAMLARLVLERHLALHDFPDPAVCTPSFVPLDASAAGGRSAGGEGGCVGGRVPAASGGRPERSSERRLSERISPPPPPIGSEDIISGSSPPLLEADGPRVDNNFSGRDTSVLETTGAKDRTQRCQDPRGRNTEGDYKKKDEVVEEEPSFVSFGPEDDSGVLEVGSSASTTMAARKKIEDASVQLTGKPRLNKMFRDTSLIPDKALSFEVHMCLLHDDVYGPFADTIKHSIGYEYEILLCRKLEERGIGYKTEEDLRVLGCDKTPDVKLDVPIGVDGHVVNWIESKASFGDRECHKQHLRDQFWSYWNRFGPGLVIYWYGYIDDLDNLGEKGILLRESFPTDIVQLNPTAASGSGT